MSSPIQNITASLAALLGAAAGSAANNVYYESFESYQLGAVPGGGWTDTNARIDDPRTPSPNAVVIDTIGANGQATKAVQIVDSIGTSSGIIREVAPTHFQQLQMDVRIDQFSDANRTWPGGIGLIKDMGADDLNKDPQAVLYAWEDRQWHFFVKNGDADTPGQAIDFVIPGLAPIELGRWYTLYVDADSNTGRFTAAVYDGATQQLLNGVIFDFPDWDPTFGHFDAITAFDGESPTAVGTQGGVSTYDNVYYIPAPGAPCSLAAAMLLTAQRRRRNPMQ